MNMATKLEATLNELLEEVRNENSDVKEVVIITKYSSSNKDSQIRRISSNNS